MVWFSFGLALLLGMALLLWAGQLHTCTFHIDFGAAEAARLFTPDC